MTATRNAVLFGTGVNSARAGKLAALGLGIALFASACGGGSSTPSGSGGGASSAPAAASGLTCPGPGEDGGPTGGATGNPADVPKSKGSTDQPLKIGTLLPTTGSLAFLGPPEIAGVNLASRKDQRCRRRARQSLSKSSTATPVTPRPTSPRSPPRPAQRKVSAIVGAASSGVSKTVINQITGAGVLQFSPANTSPDFTTWDDKGLYWRTAPSDVLQGTGPRQLHGDLWRPDRRHDRPERRLRNRPGEERQGSLRRRRRQGRCPGDCSTKAIPSSAARWTRP